MFPIDSKILIVDDSTFARSVLKRSLRDLKYWKILEASAVEAAKGLMAEDEQQKDPVHLVITDIQMPTASGLDFLRWIRAREEIKTIPVIVVSNSQEKSIIFEAGKLGVSHYMVKPFDTGTLREKMNSTWEKHGQKYLESLRL